MGSLIAVAPGRKNIPAGVLWFWDFIPTDKIARYRVDAEPQRNHAVAPPRITSTGSPEWRTTFSVTLPSTQRFTPDLPCVHIVISALGLFRA
jgi:hypothetical protein